ncbi:deoxynucleotidyltransferase terminal-interacting protein 2 [Clinocottus analis]|uniref:deoxynucleotidyltransferase terminal-interacting protein 2 n=1 Tax=Clinocottus analis TaxID=304258 RepID=UPI0035BFDB66
MVATRRGVRVYSPTRTNSNQSADVSASPSAGRRTRSTAKRAESPTKHALVETSSQLEKIEGQLGASPLASLLKRCTRASRLHSPEQSCTPVGSIHEAEMSDVDSCCSALTDTELPKTRTRGRQRQPCAVSQEDEETSEVESCSSAVSASKVGHGVRRSTRKKTVLKISAPEYVAKSLKKTTCNRSSAKQKTEDSELSDADSCISSVSGADASKSTTRRSTRSRRQTGPIPIYLEETSERSQTPATRARLSRASKTKVATINVCDPLSCDSDGFESGPTYSVTTRRQEKAQSTGPKAEDSDCELTAAHSPMGSCYTTRSKGTPCTSRTGSDSSSRGASSLIKDCNVVMEESENNLIYDSTLESTVILEDVNCTLLAEDGNQTLEEKESANTLDLTPNKMSVEKGVIVISEDESPPGSPKISDSPACAEEAVITPAVTDRHQQEEPCAENTDADVSEKMMMQETIQPSELLKPLQSVPVTCESASEITGDTDEKDEAVEVADVDAHAPQGDEDAASVETGPSSEEKMEVSTLNIDAQQVVDSNEVQVEFIQVTSSHQQNITVHSHPEPQTKDVIIQNTKIISLLDSSEDENEGDDDDEEEERDVSGEEVDEDLEFPAEERAGPSQKCDAAAASVGGLFMIDTRPGEEADEQYYKERSTEENASKGEEQEDPDEEFVDEEGDDDDDTELLFYSRNPQLNDLSSRIDPGIRVKDLGGLYINFDGSKPKPVSGSLQELKERKIQDAVMKKSVMGPDFEKKDAVPPYSESKHALKLKRKAEREKSTGDGWFNMKAPEISKELKGDLQVLKMRGSMDPKRFYKKNDRDGFPKYFQVGTVVDNPVDFYHSRVPKKERKRTMVEELLSDAEFRHNNKKKYQHIVTEKAAQGAGKRNKKSNNKKTNNKKSSKLNKK